MTLNELRTEVAALGFEPAADTDPILISAANRALATLSSDIPMIKTLRAPSYPYTPSYYFACMHHSAGERTELSLSGRAYAFCVSGKGCFTEISDSGRITQEFDTHLSDYRGFIKGNVRLIFEGDDYDILELSVFERIISNDLADIPLFPENRIKPDEIVDDFAAFCELPRDSRGHLLADARIDGRELVLPLEHRGIVTVRYKKIPKRISHDTVEIDVDANVEHLLAVLTAYFVWLDDEPSLAESYLELYKKLLPVVKQRTSGGCADYTEALGWA